MKKLKLLVVSILFTVVLMACGGSPDFADMFEDIADHAWIEIASDGSFIRLDTNPRNVDGGDISILAPALADLDLILEELDFTAATRERMTATRALDGRQEAENDSFRASWTFHPNNGLVVIFEINE